MAWTLGLNLRLNEKLKVLMVRAQNEWKQLKKYIMRDLLFKLYRNNKVYPVKYVFFINEYSL